MIDRDVPFPDAESAFQPKHVSETTWRRAKEGGHQRMLAVRAREPRKTPEWVNGLARRGHRQRLEQARALADAEVWLYSGDELALDIKSLVNEMPLEELPGYSPERRDGAVRFWQGWQNPTTGRFYDPATTDPSAPADPDDFCNEKYVIGAIRSLGAEPLHPHVTAAPSTAAAGCIDPEFFLDFCANEPSWIEGGWHAGSWAGGMALELMNAIEDGQTDLVPVLEQGVATILAHQDPETGLWGGPDAKPEYGLSGALKVLMRFHYYLGVENLPHMARLGDTLIERQAVWLAGPNTNDCFPRNAAEVMAICLEVSDYRRDDLFFALDALAQRYECMADDPRTQTHEHGLGILAGYLHWRDCELYNPKAWLHRGLAYRRRVLVRPDGSVDVTLREG